MRAARTWTAAFRNFSDLPAAGNLQTLTFNFDLTGEKDRRVLHSLQYTHEAWRVFAGLQAGTTLNGITTVRGHVSDFTESLAGTGPSLLQLFHEGRITLSEPRIAPPNFQLLATFFATAAEAASPSSIMNHNQTAELDANE